MAVEVPIRILHVFRQLNLGGAESRTMDIYRRIDRNKIQFDFAVHTQEEGCYDAEVERLGGLILSFPMYKIYNGRGYKKYWHQFLMEHSEYEVIHIHTTSIAKPILFVTHKRKLPVVITHSRNAKQTGLLKNMYIKLSKRTIRSKSTHMLAVSDKAARYIYSSKLVSRRQVQIVKNGIDALKFKFSEFERRKVRKSFSFNGETIIGHVGRFVKQKNHKFLLKIFKDYKILDPSAKLILIGIGPLQERVKAQVREVGLDKDVLFLGLRKDVKELMQGMDLLLFPSLFEGLPGVVLESQAAGLPALVSSEISNEIKITNLVEMLELEKSSIEWAKKMKVMLETLPRRNTYDELLESGNDVLAVAQWYDSFYSNALQKL